MLFGFSLRLGDFPHILTSKMHFQNHLYIDFGSFSHRFGIDLVLQGRIWMDSDWPGLDFSLILDWFLLYFKWSERTFCKQWLDEQYALIAALNIAICCHINFSRWHLVRRAAHRAWNWSPQKVIIFLFFSIVLRNFKKADLWFCRHCQCFVSFFA